MQLDMPGTICHHWKCLLQQAAPAQLLGATSCRSVCCACKTGFDRAFKNGKQPPFRVLQLWGAWPLLMCNVLAMS